VPFVYILRCADGTLYTGWAKDVARRVAAHNAGRGARYTRTHRPVELIYTEEVATIGDALKRELAIKRYPRERKLALCLPVAKKRRRRNKSQ
jgi:putative endonuclease